MIGDGTPKKQVNLREHVIDFVFSLFLLATLLFLVFRFIPSDPVRTLIEKAPNPFAAHQLITSEQSVLNEQLGLNQNTLSQLAHFYRELLSGRMGLSLWTGKSVGKVIRERISITLYLALFSFFFFLIFGIVWGFFQAVFTASNFGEALRFFNSLWFCIPAFSLAAIFFPVSPPVPAEILALLIHISGTVPTLSALIRNRLLAEESKPYARAAKARGLSRPLLLRRHLLVACIPSILSLLPWWGSMFLGTSVIVEPVFRIPGMGLLTLEAFRNQDIPVLLGVSFCFGFWRLVLGGLRDCLFYFWVSRKVGKT